MTSIYFVRDKLSGVIVSPPVPALNAGVAINGFRHFCEEQEKNGLNRSMYELIESGSFDDDGRIDSSGNPVLISTGSNAENDFKAWCTEHLEEADE